MPQVDAAARWLQLDGARSGLLRKCETFAAFTLPKICLPVGYDQNNSVLSHDWQSVGAQAVNHLCNKMMLALFAPSRPFFRYQADDDLMAQLKQLNVDEAQLAEALAGGERKAVQALDGMAARPKLYESLKHLIITGNVLLILAKDKLRVMGLKNYVTKRNCDGTVIELMIRENILVDELDQSVLEYLLSIGKFSAGRDEAQRVGLYKWVRYDSKSGDYLMTQHIDATPLPAKFGGKWPANKLPYRALTWDLSDDADYGTGLVEDYSGDFSALSTLSRAQIESAILSSEFRWLVNPGGMTKPEDLQNSENGAALPGMKDDIQLVQSGKVGELQIIQQIGADYIRRIGSGFLLGSAVTRDAERVTAEEIRQQADELETALGGAYSRLAVDFQTPMAFWLTGIIGLSLQGAKIKPIVITGLDALSRNGDIEALKLFLSDLAAVTQLPPQLQGLLRLRAIASKLAAGRGVASSEVLLGEAEVAQQQRAMQDAQQQQMNNQAAADAGGKIAVNQAGVQQ
jgi:hypothetical protein